MREKNLSNKPMICGKKKVMVCGGVKLLYRAPAPPFLAKGPGLVKGKKSKLLHARRVGVQGATCPSLAVALGGGG